MNRQFTEGKVQIAISINIQNSLIIRELQIKTTVKYLIKLIKMAKKCTRGTNIMYRRECGGQKTPCALLVPF